MFRIVCYAHECTACESFSVTYENTKSEAGCSTSYIDASSNTITIAYTNASASLAAGNLSHFVQIKTFRLNSQIFPAVLFRKWKSCFLGYRL